MNYLILSLLLAAQQVPMSQKEMSAADLAFKNKDFATAKTHLMAAIDTGELSDIGLTIVYWNLYYCHVFLKDNDAAADAIFSFIAHAQDVTSSNFIAEYDLNTKMRYAKIALDAYWAKKNPDACRTKTNRCFMTFKIDGMFVFNEVLPFCGSRKNVQKANIKKGLNQTITEVLCLDGSKETYYFINER